MPITNINGVSIHYEEVGAGAPILFCHELASDLSAWNVAVEKLSGTYRCIRFNMRGYPPSSVPEAPDAYAHETLVEDLRLLMAHLRLGSAHLVGVATGAGVALNLALAHPHLVRSLVAVGPGTGASNREAWLIGASKLAAEIRMHGTKALVASMLNAPQRVALRSKNPLQWNRFLHDVGSLSPVGCANMIENAMMRRKTLEQLASPISKLPMPVLVMVGDKDIPAFEPSVFLSRTARHGALAVLPFTGHMIPLEEPLLFHQITSGFLRAVDAGQWGTWVRESTQDDR